MPAKTAQQLHPLFQDAFNSGSIERLLSLYEENATMVPPGAPPVTGKAAIGGSLSPVLAMGLQMKLETVFALESGELAMLSCRWVAEGKGPDGNPLRLNGTSSEVARRQADGTWLYVIDDPGTGS
jgi:ketosteroid isomerase-like protein